MIFHFIIEQTNNIINNQVDSFIIKIKNNFTDEKWSKKTNIINFLLSQKYYCCPYCICRYLNFNDVALFSQDIEFMKLFVLKLLNKDQQEKYINDLNSQKTCYLCDNIFQIIQTKEYKENLIKYMHSQQYEFTEYLLTINCPVYFQLNDLEVIISMINNNIFNQEENLSSINPYEHQSSELKQLSQSKPTDLNNLILPLKKVLKYHLGPYCSVNLPAKVKYNSYYMCNINILTTNDVQLPEEIQNSLNKFLRKALRQQKQDDCDVISQEINRYLNKYRLGDELNQKLQTLIKRADNIKIDFTYSLYREIIYITGRYMKLQRGIAQTGDEKDDDENIGAFRLDYSIEGIFDDIFKKYLHYDKLLLTASGREDIDVKMLGNGRPFILQLINCRNILSCDIEQLYNNVKNDLLVKDFVRLDDQVKLHYYEKREDKLMKAMAASCQEKKKLYRAVIVLNQQDYQKDQILKQKIQELHNKLIDIKQLTPIRVLHRRPLLMRDKQIYSIDLIKQFKNFYVIDILASAGCYIKEFVHGDFNRTQPNFRTLLDLTCDVQIIQLDVVGVQAQWPPEDLIDQWDDKQ